MLLKLEKFTFLDCNDAPSLPSFFIGSYLPLISPSTLKPPKKSLLRVSCAWHLNELTNWYLESRKFYLSSSSFGNLFDCTMWKLRTDADRQIIVGPQKRKAYHNIGRELWKGEKKAEPEAFLFRVKLKLVQIRGKSPFHVFFCCRCLHIFPFKWLPFFGFTRSWRIAGRRSSLKMM